MILLKPTGPFNVGCFDIMTPATKIPEELTPDFICADDTELGTLASIYYPCGDDVNEDTCERTPWLPSRNGDWYCSGFMQQKSYRWLGFLAKYYISDIKQNAWMNAEVIDPKVWSERQKPLKGATKMPLVIVSHGLNGCRSLHSAFCTELASEGFIVVSIEHRDGSASASFIIDETGTDIEIQYSMKDTAIMDDSDEVKVKMRQMQLKQRAKEVSKLLDLIEFLNNTPKDIDNVLNNSIDLSVFKDFIDVENPMLLGHSFGGATVMKVLQKDPRFKSGIALDPWSIPFDEGFYDSNNQIKHPLLAIMTELWKWDRNVEKMNKFSRSQPEGICEILTLRKAGHLDQCDVALFTPWWFKFGGKELFGNEDINALYELQRKVTTTYFLKCLQSKSTIDSPVKFVEENEELLKDFFITGYNM